MVVLASLVAALLLGEITLRSLLDTNAYRIWPPGLETVFRPAPGIMPGVEGDSRFRIDARGWRSDEPEPGIEYQILVLGGSTTECLYLDQEEAWPALVQAGLRARADTPSVQVANGGVSGRTTWHHLIQARHLLEQHPELDALLLMCGVNDLALCLSHPECSFDLATPPALPGPVESEARLLSHSFAVLPLSSSREAWYRRTAYWRLASVVKDRVVGVEQIQDEAGDVYRRWRSHRASASELRAAVPDLENAILFHRSNLAAIAELCRDRRCRLVLVTHPAVWAPDLPEHVRALLWMGGIGDFQNVEGCPYYEPEVLAEGLAAYNRAMCEVAAAEGIECIDLAAALGPDPALFYDDVHLNEAGARLAARVVADHLLARPPFR